MLSLTLTLALATSQLADVRVSIVVDDGRARVETRYRLTPTVDSVVYSAIRIPGQSIILSHNDTPMEYESRPGLNRLVLTADAGSEGLHAIAYELTGNVRRVALFVPDVTTVPGPKVVSIEVRGVGQAQALADAFPRLQREANGVLVAQLADMPSFVLIPGRTGPIGATRLADLAAITVVAFGTLYWLLRRPSRS